MVTRLVGGLTPGDGADPRTFPAIWNATADEIEAVESGLGSVESTVTALGGTVSVQALITEANSTAIAGLDSTVSSQGAAIVSQGSAITVLEGSAVALGSAVFDLEADLSNLELGDLADVTIGTAVADGEVLAYSTAVSGWVNAAGGAGGGKILQVVQAVKTDTSSITTTSFATIPGLSVSITPASASSKFLLIANLNVSYLESSGVSSGVIFRFGGGNSGDFVGDTAAARERIVAGEFRATNGTWEGQRHYGGSYVDSPATSSAITYAIEGRTIDSTGYVNRTGRDLDGAYYPRSSSSLIVLEVAP
jgi:hypothetical protein